MNHDYAHCLDYSDDCPEECFRGMLVRDLHKQDIKIASWTHFIDTNECMLKRKEKEMIELFYQTDFR